ncbi:MAG: acyltransferase [Saccharofermentanales bacterium]|jgi:acetyltransferase-like isoleucine patch superfamily enzyme|nr:acyltransferase [Bacillota bacterium]
MKNNVQNIYKILPRIKTRIIKLISHFNHPVYMKFYIKALKRQGMDIEGQPLYIGATTSFDGKDYSKIHISDKVVISSDVRLLTHDYSLSRAFVASGIQLEREVYTLRDIHIGENSFIGTKSIIMPGTKIGKNVIVGAGSVVRGEIPDNSIVIGNPAQVVANTIEWAKRQREKGDYLENE